EPARPLPDLPPLFITYHEVTTENSLYRYHVTCKQLESQLACITEKRGRFQAHITFDDGHRSGYQHAVPLLQHYGVCAIFFVTAGWTNVRAGYMRSTELRELVDLGHDVQSH